MRHDDVFYAAASRRFPRARTLGRGVFISIYLCVSDCRCYYIIIIIIVVDVKEKEDGGGGGVVGVCGKQDSREV